MGLFDFVKKKEKPISIGEKANVLIFSSKDDADHTIGYQKDRVKSSFVCKLPLGNVCVARDALHPLIARLHAAGKAVKGAVGTSFRRLP